MINEDYQKMFLDKVEESINGNVFMLPNPYSRLGMVFNTVRGRFVLVGGQSSVGKTAFTDDLYILKAYDYVKNFEDFHFETLYFSMERSRAFKYAKWTSWFIYKYERKRISADKLLGYDGTGPITKEEHRLMLKYRPMVEDLLERVHVYDGRTDYDTLLNSIRSLAFKLGTLYKSDDVGVKINDSDEYIDIFTDDRIETTKVGTMQYILVNHEGVEFKLQKNQNRYFYKNPKTLIQIVIDGIGLIKRNGGSTKNAIDDVIDLLADARDIFEFNIIVISQFNRGISETLRQVHHGENLAPREADFKDSSSHYQAADLVLALFDPYKMQAANEEQMYRGYHLPSLMAPQGFSRFRTLHILKNTFGIADVAVGMLFIGESNWFETLPRTDDESGLHEIYSRIKLNKL
jgi:hypothetical protein